MKYGFLVFAFLIYAVLGRAESVDTSVAETPNIWRLESDGQVFHILGTFHSSNSDLLPPFVFRLLDNSSKVYFEIDYNEFNALRAAQASKTSDMPLQQQISEEAWARLVTEIGGLYTHDELNKQSLFTVLTVLLQKRAEYWSTRAPEIELLKAEAGSTLGQMDQQLFVRAQGNQQDVAGLEAAAIQVTLFNPTKQSLEALISLSPDEQRREIVGALQQVVKFNRRYAEGVRASIINYRVLQSQLPPRVHEALVVNRNVAWLPHIEAAPDGAFFVVGHSHLYGQKGLLAMLKARGFKITLVTSLNCDEILAR